MREMKDSGFPWIGKIPASWTVIKSKYILVSNDGGVWGADPRAESPNKIVLRSTEQTIDGKWSIENPAVRDLTGIAYEECRISPGDLLVTKSSGSASHIGKTTLADDYFLEHECYYSNFLQRLRVSCYPKFAWYLFNTQMAREQFVYRQNSTSGIGNINSVDLENVYFPYPPLPEQRLIASFLDGKCAEIDALTADIQQQIDALEQYKRSVITESVTKGLNPEAKMKDSGIEWIGEIPESWEIMPNKYIMHKEKIICPIYQNEDILSLTMNGVIVRDLDAGGKMPKTFDGYQKIRKGNLLMCLFDIDVTPRCIGIINSDGLTSPAYSQFILHNNATANYYYYYYLMLDFTKELLHMAKNLRHSLTEEQLGAIQVPVPPVGEQKAIADYLDAKCAEIDGIISQKREQISTIEEYKKSLIFEYVTGKKEVPNNE